MNEEIKNMKRINLVGFGGSLREGSFNQALLEAGVLLEEAMHICPAEGKLEIFDGIGDFPLYSQDLEAKMPDVVKVFKNKIKQADAILIATPEYDYSLPGYLKNAIDWASRPYGDNSFDDKPAAIMSASPGMLGGVRAQYALRQTCVFLNLHLLNKPEVLVPSIHEKIKDGKLVDAYTTEKIQELLVALCEWTRRLKK
jgi:chromate reductase, NAD(P)H dehydrogenase (quinone)